MSDTCRGPRQPRQPAQEWSDARCIEIACEDSFPATCLNINIQKRIISRFLNFYLSGKIQTGLSVTDVVFSSIAIMPKSYESENSMWGIEEYTECGTLFFLSPEDKLQAEINKIVPNRQQIVTESPREEHSDAAVASCPTSDSDARNEASDSETGEGTNEDSDEYKPSVPSQSEPASTEPDAAQPSEQHAAASEDADVPFEGIKWFRSKVGSKSLDSSNTEYGPKENAAFCSYCNKLLGEWESSGQARLTLKLFFGIAALTLLRTVCKTYENITNTFTNNFAKRITFFRAYSPPDAACVRKCFKTFHRSDRKIGVMFAKLVVQSLLLERQAADGSSDLRLRNVIKLGVLAHAAYARMDLVNMMQAAYLYSSGHFHVMMEVLSEADELTNSMKRICDFFQKYMSGSGANRLATCYWACVVEREQFQDLSCRHNYALAVVVAVFIEKLSCEPDIWKSKWLRHGDQLLHRQLGVKLFAEYERRTCSR